MRNLHLGNIYFDKSYLYMLGINSSENANKFQFVKVTIIALNLFVFNKNKRVYFII